MAGKPHARVSPGQRERFVRLRQEGWNRSAAAREVGVSLSWAKKLELGHSGNGSGYAAVRERLEVPQPVPFEGLGEAARRGFDDFEFFRRYYLGHVSTPWQVETAERLIGLLATPDKEFVVENCPPGVGKTTLVHDIACWATVRDRRVRGLIGSRKANNARRMVGRIRRSLERVQPVKAPSEAVERGLAVDALGCLAADYGVFKPASGQDIWRSEEFVVAQLDDVPIEEKEPTWSSYGVDSGVLGNRFEVIFWDDLVDRTNTRTAEVRQGLEEMWDSELENRLEPAGLLVLLGQRLGSGELYWYCRSKTVEPDPDEPDSHVGEPMYHRIVYPAHDETRCQGVHKPSEAKPQPEGCLLDPYRLPWRDLRKIQSTNRTTWEVTYQQRDVDPEGVLVNPLWVSGGKDAQGNHYPGCWDTERGINDRPPVADGFLSVISIDSSPTKFWAITWWVDPRGSELRYLMDLYRQKMQAPDVLYGNPAGEGVYSYSGLLENWRARAQEMRLPVTHLIVEQNASERFFTQQLYFRQWCSEHKIQFRPHQTNRNKHHPEYGIESMRDLWKFGLIRLPGKANDPGRTNALKLVDEVQKWPGGSSDDCVHSHWFHEIALPQIGVVDLSKIPQFRRPSWLKEPA